LSYGARRLLVHVAAALALFGAAPALAAERLVLAFGDSLTAGYGLKPAEAFPAQLERALRRDGLAVRVHNAGVSGDTSAAGRARLGWVLNGLKAKPDLVILELGANDMLRGLKPAETRANLEAMLVELKRRRVPVLLAGMLASPNMGPDFRRDFDRIFPDLARRHGARLYPFFMKGVAGQRPLLLADGMHPNARGVSVIVRGIAPQVKVALGPKG
jgi:acyl-CoA thioesterase-1